MTLEGRVAAIVSVREVAINIGTSNGVLPGMTFAILAETPLPVHDPDTGKELGEIDRVKVRVKATEVHAKFSVCRTYETYETPGILPTFPLRGVQLYSTREVRTLRIKDSEVPAPLPEEESYVKVGDIVRQVPPQG